MCNWNLLKPRKTNTFPQLENLIVCTLHIDRSLEDREEAFVRNSSTMRTAGPAYRVSFDRASVSTAVVAQRTNDARIFSIVWHWKREGMEREREELNLQREEFPSAAHTSIREGELVCPVEILQNLWLRKREPFCKSGVAAPFHLLTLG